MKDKMSFEDALEKLNEISQKIKSSNIGLEESIACYEEGIKYYNICSEWKYYSKAGKLQKIETYDIDN